MSNQHQILLNSIATTIADYRQGEIPVIHPNHVEKWVRQFDKFGFDQNAQKVILEQMDRILKNYYIARQVAQEFVTDVLTFEAIFGYNPAKTIKNGQFLRVQAKGNSQNDLLSLTEKSLQNLYDLNFDDCDKSPVIYIYLDDCLYSGNRVRRDIDSWLSNAVEGTTLHLIFLGIHSDEYDYSRKIIQQKAQPKNIIVEFWRLHEFHNNRWKPFVEDSRKDDFWGAKPVDEEILIGINVLGRLLMQLREQVKTGEITSQTIVRPLSIPNFLLYEREINPVSTDGECYLDSNAEVSVEVENEVASQLTPEVVLLSEDKYEIVGNKNDTANSIVEIKSDFNKYDAFHIVLPHIEELLNTECTDKELAERLNIPLTLMRTWLERAVKLGKISKLRKPVRYVLECQLSLLNQM